MAVTMCAGWLRVLSLEGFEREPHRSTCNLSRYSYEIRPTSDLHHVTGHYPGRPTLDPDLHHDLHHLRGHQSSYPVVIS